MASQSNSFSSIASTAKKRRNPPGNPDPDAEVIALSPKTLLATNRYICEVCHKGFQRDQNLQLHRRGHNLPWKLKQKSGGGGDAKKRVYVCPETTCTHHGPTRALGDLTGIKKHYSRKHGEKKWKCDKCTKRYAVQSDWKAHSKICGTKEYRCCDCGTIFSRKDSFVTHRAFCEALNEEKNGPDHGLETMVRNLFNNSQTLLDHTLNNMPGSDLNTNASLKSLSNNHLMPTNSDMLFSNSSLRISGSSSLSVPVDASFMSATALLQKTTDMGAKFSYESISPILLRGFTCLTNNNAPNLDTAEVSTNVGIQNSAQTRPETAGFAPGLIRTASSVPFSVGKERKTDSIHIKRDIDGRKGKMTQDFLGLNASGRVYVSGTGNSSYQEDELHPYHQISHHLPTTFENKMWQ